MAEGELSPAKEQHYQNELKVLHAEVEKHKSDGIISEEEKEKTKTELSKLLKSIQEDVGPDVNHNLYTQIASLARGIAEYRKKQKTEKEQTPVPKKPVTVPDQVIVQKTPKESILFGINTKELPGYIYTPHTEYPRLVDVRGMKPGDIVICPHTQKKFRLPLDFKSADIPPVKQEKPREEKPKLIPNIGEIIEKNTIKDSLDLRKIETAQIVKILDFLTKAKKIPGNIAKIYIQKSFTKGHEQMLDNLSDKDAVLILDERGQLLYGRIRLPGSEPRPREDKEIRSLSSEDEAELCRSVGEFQGEKREKDSQNSDTFNRTFPGRLNDHIDFLRDQLKGQPTYFIDIGPGVGDFQDKDGKLQREYPAITSLEMAKAFNNNHVIALDLIDSIHTLNNARKNDTKIGAELLGRTDVQVVGGDGMKPLLGQLRSSTDVYKKPIKMPEENETVVIRACNSIDIYFAWEKLQPVIEGMGRDFEKYDVILFFGKKILKKTKGSTQFHIIGEVSDRGFNHNNQTTKHVPKSVPPYTLREKNTSLQNNQSLEKVSPQAVAFLKELKKSGDRNIAQTGQFLEERFGKLDEAEQEILSRCTPHMHTLNEAEKQLFYTVYDQHSDSEYRIVVNIHEEGQKAYLVDPSGVPQLAFDISSGKGSLTPTGNYSIKTREEDLRTIPYTRFGQAYKLWNKRGMLNWDSGAQMTTAILSMDTPGNIYFHGTNKEKNLGKKDSAGCIRMDNLSMAFLSTFFDSYGIKNVSIVEKREIDTVRFATL